MDANKKNRMLEAEIERLRTIAENITEVFWLRSADNKRMIYVSPSYEKVWGRSADSLVKHPNSFIDAVHEDDKEIVATAFNQYMKSGMFDIEFRIKQPNKSIRWIWSRSYPIKDNSGNAVYHTGIAIDITHKKDNEALIIRKTDFEHLLVMLSDKFISARSKDIDNEVETGLGKAGMFLNVDRSYIFLFNADKETMSNTHEWCAPGIEPQLNRIQNLPVADLFWWVAQIKNREYVYIPDVNELPAEAHAEKEEFLSQGIRSLLSVPLHSEGKLIGFFGFDAVKEKKIWEQENIGFMKVIAGILAGGIEKSRAGQKIYDYAMEVELNGIELEELYRRLDEEMDKARMLHEQTLPRILPEVAGITFAAYYRPALKLGGDYYQVMHQNNKLIIYLADVSGHGLDGAMLNVFVKEAINSYLYLNPEVLKPQSILKYLHARYCAEEYPDDYFVCLFMAVLELETMEFTYAGAGFQSLPLIAGDGRQEVLHCEGPPISAVFPPEMVDFTENRCIITPGTAIIISTDGLPEQIGHNGQQYGDTGRFEAVFYQNSHLPPEQIVKRINADFHDFINHSDTDDDITYLILSLAKITPGIRVNGLSGRGENNHET